MSPEISLAETLTSSIELPSADDVLRRLIAASAGVETGSYEMSVSSDVKVEGLEVPVSMKIFGDYQEPDRQQVVVEVGVSFFKIQIEMVIIGDMVYVRDSFTGSWTIEEDGSTTEGFHEFVDLIPASDLMGSVALVGESIVDGRRVLHLEGDVPAELLGEAGEGIESLWVRYSVGFDDHLMYGSEIRMTDDEGSVTTVTFRFFDYGKEVDIQAPEVAGLNFMGFDCDETLRQQLVFQRGASTAANMNDIIAQLQAAGSECRAALWNPRAADGAGDDVRVVTAVWASDAIATGISRCFGATAIAANTDAARMMSVGSQKVPRGLRNLNSGDNLVRNVTGRDSDNNILVYWSSTDALRPSDGAKCWLYVSRLRSWFENY